MAAKTKRANESWDNIVDELVSELKEYNDGAKDLYSVAQIGLEVGFYKYEEGKFTPLAAQLHLVRDANDVVYWFDYIKANPLCLG